VRKRGSTGFSSRGQALAEYVIVLGVLFLVFLTGAQMIENAFQGYMNGIAFICAFPLP